MIPFKDTIFALLPKGPLFSKDSEPLSTKDSAPLSTFVEKLSREFDRGRSFLLQRFSEIPGVLTTSLEDWEKFAGLPDDCAPKKEDRAGRNISLVSKLSATGGQSLSYLSEVATRTNSGKEVKARNVSRNEIALDGIRLVRKSFQMTCQSHCNKPVREFEREEKVICAMEKIIHAHLERRYHDREGTDYGKN